MDIEGLHFCTRHAKEAAEALVNPVPPVDLSYLDDYFASDPIEY